MKRVMLLGLLLICMPAFAAFEVQGFDDAEREARYKVLINELRCLVCQNQTIADSNAGLAKTLRQETFRMINEGATDEEIIKFMVTRYGDFVLYKPPLKAMTIVLWVGPFVLLIIALLVITLVIRHNRSAAIPVNTGDLEKFNQLLDQEDHAK